jgi:hypothetical protein
VLKKIAKRNGKEFDAEAMEQEISAAEASAATATDPLLPAKQESTASISVIYSKKFLLTTLMLHCNWFLFAYAGTGL